ncbi:MAG: dicarboxylate/amino acid:cation symporter [Rhizomicrobium sp.]
MSRTFALLLLTAMVLGIAVGLAGHAWLDAGQIAQLTDGFGLVTFAFLRLIRMIIAPLVLSTLIVGIAHMEDAAAISRVGARAIAWFVLASLVSLVLGLIMVHLFQPGVGLSLPPAAGAAPATAASLSLTDFLTHLIPRSIVEAMANNEILQIVVFACFLGTAMAATQDRAPAILALAEQVAAVMLKITSYVMKVAPLVVFAALASTVATQGAGVLLTYARFVGSFYLALLLLWAVLFAVAAVIRRGGTAALFHAVRDPVLLAFSTASSEAAYPRLLEQLQRIGLPRRIVSFVLPLGYSFNLDGSTMYCTFATLFIAQAYGIDLTLGQQVTLLLIMMITSKGMAGVPRASLVVILAALPYFHIPEAGLLLVLAVDHLLDMGRSGTNIVGNAVACVVVDAWEGRAKPVQ